MLKRVAFILKKENALQEMRALLEDIKKHQAKADILSYMENDNDMEETAAWMQECLTSGTKETLYVTDCADCHKKLQFRNMPVIVYLHEDNRQEDFSTARYAIENLSEIEYKSLELAYLRLTGQPWDILETDRCRIRETTTDDIDSFYEIYKEPSITKYLEDLYTDKEEEIAYIRDYIKNVYGFYGYGMWTVIEKNSGEIIGRAGISLREGYDIPELGFVIGVPWQRQGYAYEVCRAIFAYGQKELGFTRFHALVMKGNGKSKRLCEKLGFTFWEDVEMDGVVYERMGIDYENEYIRTD
ncbi:MAG: GNAT family N-acetyltransferase [Bacillus sp. (in: Bacteria)]|nr:GNAT family N-acetyltransferase [Bacillus sp. (in: firmicutes)]MCM1425039.1 GNAT family N-acetyltransferase [Eubacterium sp.]